jgi:hypothetical protein
MLVSFTSLSAADVYDRSLANTAKAEAHHIQEETIRRYSDQVTRFLNYYLQTMEDGDFRRPHFLSHAHKEAVKKYNHYFATINPPQVHNPAQYTEENATYYEARQVVLETILAFFCDAQTSATGGQPIPPPDAAGSIGFNAEKLVHPIAAFAILSCVKVGEVLAKPVEASRLVAALQWALRLSVWAKAKMEHDCDQPPGITIHRRVEIASEMWCREFKGTIFSWLRGIMHLSSQFVMTESPVGRFVYAGNDVFLIDGQSITLSDWQRMIRTFMGELPQAFEGLLDLLGLDESALGLPGNIRDVIESSSLNYWLGSEVENDLSTKARAFAIKGISGKPRYSHYPSSFFMSTIY